MSNPSFLHILVAALFVAAGHPALAVDQTTIDQVVNVAKIGYDPFQPGPSRAQWVEPMR